MYLQINRSTTPRPYQCEIINVVNHAKLTAVIYLCGVEAIIDETEAEIAVT